MQEEDLKCYEINYPPDAKTTYGAVVGLAIQALVAEIRRLHGIMEEGCEAIDRLRDAQKCASCGGTILPPMQCGSCIETQRPVPGMPERPATTNLQERLKEAWAAIEAHKQDRAHDREQLRLALLQVQGLKTTLVLIVDEFNAGCNAQYLASIAHAEIMPKPAIAETPKPARALCGVWVPACGPCVAYVPCEVHGKVTEKQEGDKSSTTDPSDGGLAT
jgi:hypothetical protein